MAVGSHENESLADSGGYEALGDLGLEASPPRATANLPLPATREALLAEVEAERRRIYETVRELLDEVERVAPWSALYYPPDVASEFLAMIGRLADLVRKSPARLRQLIDNLRLELDESGAGQSLDDIAFYVSGIHEMLTRDLGKLDGKLAAVAGGSELSAEQRELLCELAADLKGKYASAIMGATASIVAEGRWQGLAIEPILFEEKAEEFARNRELLEDLQSVLAAIASLPREVPFAELRNRWLHGQRVDQYALADLPTFRGRLGQLLKERRRRALYSGDYRQIQRRERRLSTRLNELEELHHLTWSTPPSQAAEVLVPVFERLAALILEIAAVVDVALLERLLGEKTVRSLRSIVVLEREEARRLERDGEQSEVALSSQLVLRRRTHPRRQGLTDEQHALIPLLYEEDLRTFFELLLGSVAKRASLSLPTPRPAEEDRPPPPATVPAPAIAPSAEPVPPVDAQVLSALPAVPPAPVVPAPPTPPAAAPPRPRPPATRAAPLTPRQREERVAAARLIRDELGRLRGPASATWKSFRMLQRLVERQHAVPPSMLQAAHPFLREILEGLVPRLAAAIAVGDLEPAVVEAVGGACRFLLDPTIGPREISERGAETMGRIVRLLDALEAATGAVLAG